MPVVFFGGVHGAGKTSLCRRLVLATGADHVTAGSLIRDGTASNAAEKRVDKVVENQQRLLLGLERRQKPGSTLLLDGHFCLITGNQQIERIQASVFERIAPAAMVLVQCEPEIVQQRLKARDHIAYDLPLITALAQSEDEHATSISKELGVPLLRFPSVNPEEEVARFIESALSNLGR